MGPSTTWLRNSLLAEYSIRYGGYGAIAYHHVADTYVALFSHFIPSGVWEAIYIIEGLLKNTSELQPTTVHSDTQGQSTPVYALAHLLGIKLMPRIRNWQDLRFYRPSKDARYKHIEPLFSETIDWGLIETHWQDLMQVALSIKAGAVSSALLLRKLGTYSRKSRLYQAFRELGRVVRTEFLLRFLADSELRQQIMAGTNKVEAYHGFAKWLHFGWDGLIQETDPEEQDKRIKYNDLVANAVAIQNVIDLTRAVRELIREGYPVKTRGSGGAEPLPDPAHQALRRLPPPRWNPRTLRRRARDAADHYSRRGRRAAGDRLASASPLIPILSVCRLSPEVVLPSRTCAAPAPGRPPRRAAATRRDRPRRPA